MSSISARRYGTLTTSDGLLQISSPATKKPTGHFQARALKTGQALLAESLGAFTSREVVYGSTSFQCRVGAFKQLEVATPYTPPLCSPDTVYLFEFNDDGASEQQRDEEMIIPEPALAAMDEAAESARRGRTRAREEERRLSRFDRG